MAVKCIKCSTVFSTDEEFRKHYCSIQICAGKGALFGIIRLSEEDLSRDGFGAVADALVEKINEHSGTDFNFHPLPDKKIDERIVTRILVTGRRKK